MACPRFVYPDKLPHCMQQTSRGEEACSKFNHKTTSRSTVGNQEMSSLYSDLVESQDAVELKQLKDELDRERLETIAREARIAELEQELEIARTENETLKLNISAIFHTAKKEVQRKDNLIAELRGTKQTLTSSSLSSSAAVPSSFAGSGAGGRNAWDVQQPVQQQQFQGFGGSFQ